ncbi:WD40/YVTN/BNR-like repeat-containing protein [Xylophilus ampelinus]|uniref:BNR/Asp-box repeat protein n=1 Tax=Xylophilus ampelinus TaxID=54067 RepID=A0A318SMU2_9BURK|nr:carbohydrate-binding protein [Xylophilus ampelinus]MCS4510068.1 xyloglucanase [Xylophilus ampelinus]PYE78213.1 hypothetical protein DFQ15_1082 [Xylophilus ampelinus]
MKVQVNNNRVFFIRDRGRQTGAPVLRRIVASGLLAASTGLIAAVHAATPAYIWSNAKIIAGGFVDGIVAHPAQKGLFYARTDIGGSYRYDAATATWVPLQDATSPSNWHQMGVEAIGLDPRDPKMLYLVTGMYTENWDGNAAVLVSSNQGASFASYALPFRAGANDDGRHAGERLQVDPNLGSTLLYGTMNASEQRATNGLWASADKGQHWNKVPGFSALSSDGTGAGVAFVAFHAGAGRAGSATHVVFAGVSTASAASTGTTLYKSTDGGTSWSALVGGPQGQYPTHGQIGPDGNLYITYGKAIGPNGMTGGDVWKYSVASGTWRNITPPNPNGYSFGYGGLAIDPQRPGTLVVMTMDRWWPGDTMFRSTDGGTTWSDVGASATRDPSLSPWVKMGSNTVAFGNWGQVAVDPFDSDHAFYATGQTVWTTRNLTAADSGGPTRWTVGAGGIEETAVLALISPTVGAPLISGVGDICGFVHADLTTSPAAGNLAHPLCNNGTGLDYAKSLPSKIVYVGTGGSSFGAVSNDGGKNWTPFASKADSTAGDGTVAIFADGTSIVWAPKDVAPVYSTDDGAHWSATGLPQEGGGIWQMLSDGVANRFYAYSPSGGRFYASLDKGANWSLAASNLPRGGRVSAVVGNNGDVWLASGSGLYRSTDAGTNWTLQPQVTSATAVGFGKAAPGASYPSIYLGGTIQGLTALFRSTDAGTTWVRINDDQHQWGGFTNVIGDPKTFGRVYVAPNSGRGVIYGTPSN